MYHQDWCFVAVQGPESPHVVAASSPRPHGLGFMQCVESEYRRRPVIVTRSGYTGEIGYELFTYQDIAVELWRSPAGGRRRRSTAGRAASRLVTCCGSRWATPCTARTCSRPRPRSRPGSPGRWPWSKGAFRGAAALERQRAEGLPSRLHRAPDARAALHPAGALPRVPAAMCSSARSRAGRTRRCCRRASRSPTSGRRTWPGPGDEVEVDIRGRRGSGDVVRPPFVDRSPR